MKLFRYRNRLLNRKLIRLALDKIRDECDENLTNVKTSIHAFIACLTVNGSLKAKKNTNTHIEYFKFLTFFIYGFDHFIDNQFFLIKSHFNIKTNDIDNNTKHK